MSALVTLDELVSDITASREWERLQVAVADAAKDAEYEALISGAMPSDFRVEIQTGWGWHLSVELV